MFYDILLIRLQPAFIEIYRKLEKQYLLKHGRRLTQKRVAEFIGIKEANLSDLLNNKRPLSAHYVWKFIIRGVFSMKDIWDGKWENEKEREFWETVKDLESGSLVGNIREARKQQIDPDELIAYAIELKKHGIDPIERLKLICGDIKKPSHPFDLL